MSTKGELVKLRVTTAEKKALEARGNTSAYIRSCVPELRGAVPKPAPPSNGSVPPSEYVLVKRFRAEGMSTPEAQRKAQRVRAGIEI